VFICRFASIFSYYPKYSANLNQDRNFGARHYIHMMKRETQKADQVLLLYVFLLVIFGLVALTSASAPVGYERFGDTYYFIKKQIFSGLIPGAALFLFFGHVNYQLWKKFSSIIYFAAVIMLLLVFIPPIGLTINGARSWIEIGAFTFQPSELAKLVTVLVLAKFMADQKRNLEDLPSGVLPIIAILSLPLFMIAAQPDVGTLSIIAVIIIAMLFLGDMPKKFLLAIAALGAIAFAVMMIVAPYRVARLNTFLHPELDPQGVGYQINQAFLAIGSGGFWGVGLGHSRQKFQYLPEVQADSIFAVVAEETGFLVSTVMVVLILLIGFRMLRIAKETHDKFGRLVVSGVAIWFVWQSFQNIGSMVGILPLTGVPLPFVSHGGSAFMLGLAAVGVVANVSKGN